MSWLSSSDPLANRGSELLPLARDYAEKATRLMKEEYPAFEGILDDKYAFYFTIAILMAGVTQLRASIGTGARFNELTRLLTESIAAWRPDSRNLFPDCAAHVEAMMRVFEDINPDPLARIHHAAGAAGSWVTLKRVGKVVGEEYPYAMLDLDVGQRILSLTSNYWDFPGR